MTWQKNAKIVDNFLPMVRGTLCVWSCQTVYAWRHEFRESKAKAYCMKYWQVPRVAVNHGAACYLTCTDLPHSGLEAEQPLLDTLVADCYQVSQHTREDLGDYRR